MVSSHTSKNKHRYHASQTLFCSDLAWSRGSAQPPTWTWGRLGGPAQQQHWCYWLDPKPSPQGSSHLDQAEGPSLRIWTWATFVISWRRNKPSCFSSGLQQGLIPNTPTLHQPLPAGPYTFRLKTTHGQNQPTRKQTTQQAVERKEEREKKNVESYLKHIHVFLGQD